MSGRIKQLYGYDYREQGLYDAVINVDDRCRDTNFSKVRQSLLELGGGAWYS